jgi:hypothetical protein
VNNCDETIKENASERKTFASMEAVMNENIVIAVIGTLGLIGAAWVGARNRERSAEIERNGGHIISGNGDIMSNSTKIKVGPRPETKPTGAYMLEKVFMFVFTFAIAGAMFGGLGFLVQQKAGGGNGFVGGGIGLVLALIAAFVNAGNVKRSKSIL